MSRMSLFPKDLQAMKLSADKPSMENHGLRTSESWSPVASAPDGQQLQAAAGILNTGKRVAILAGQGALGARAEVVKIAEALGAPVAKALLGKAVLPDDSPYTTGGIGHMGTQPSQWIMQELRYSPADSRIDHALADGKCLSEAGKCPRRAGRY